MVLLGLVFEVSCINIWVTCVYLGYCRFALSVVYTSQVIGWKDYSPKSNPSTATVYKMLLGWPRFRLGSRLARLSRSVIGWLAIRQKTDRLAGEYDEQGTRLLVAKSLAAGSQVIYLIWWSTATHILNDLALFSVFSRLAPRSRLATVHWLYHNWTE